ncbi:MAG: hypothetical protein M5U08_08340 [Burkholderiales bacterium]|nr:hypothetical protein [Burkholderiales bacterium]
MEIPREHQQVLIAMGVAVLMLQVTERVIRLCMTIVLQKQSPLTLEALQAQEEFERNKALGYFVAELRKRADLQDGFDALLKDFLKNRNDFIHDLSRVPGWELGSEEQTEKAKRFVHGLIHQSDRVLKVFLGLVSAWQEQVGVPDTSFSTHEWLSEIERIYKPLADQVFFAKDA